MKRLITVLAVFFASTWFVGSLPAWAGSDECSSATLQGSYGFERQGFNPAVGHVGAIGVITFDGNGNYSGAQTNVTEARGVVRNTFIGTYEVSPDCRGSLGSGPGTGDLVIVSGGNEVFLIATDDDPPGAQRVVTYVAKKQFPD